MKTLTVPANLESLSPLGRFVVAAAEEGGLDTRAGYRLRLAVDEIATNAILYGAAAGDGQGVLELRVQTDERTLRVTLEDSGSPYDPRQAPPPEDLHLPLEQRGIGGLGVHLALTGVDDFSYERVGDKNRHTFVMNRPPAAPAG